MLDKVPAPELISATVEGSVRPYSLEHQLPLDELLLQYIKVSTYLPGDTLYYAFYLAAN